MAVSAEDVVAVPGGDEFLEGRRLQQAGEWAASIEQFRAAADLYSIVGDYALYQMAQSALQEGNTELAASSLEKLLNLHPETPVKRIAQLDLINLYFNAGEPARAAPLIEATLPGAESSRESIGLMLMLARSYEASDDISKCDSLCWRIIHGWPSKSEAVDAAELVREVDTPQRRLAIAKVYLLNKKTQKTINVLKGLLEDPNAVDLRPEVFLCTARALALKGKRQDAGSLYNEIISNYLDSSAAAQALFERAKYKRATGALQDALADYAQVVERFPNHSLVPQALWERAKIFETLDDPKEYIQYEKILADYPRSRLAVSSMMYWGLKLYRAGDYSGARRIFEKLLAAKPRADAAFWVAKCSLAEGKTNSAKVQFAGVINRFKESHQAFRARSILKTLTEVEMVYSRQNEENWQDLLVYDVRPFVSYEADSPETAYGLLEKELSHLDQSALERLGFLMRNRLSEAESELEHILREHASTTGKYMLAWALFQAGAYNDSIKAASSLRDRLAEATRETRLQYLRYPLAYPDLVGPKAAKYKIDPLLSLAVMREESHFRKDAISVSDARGLMQIIPPTGEWLAGKVFGPAAFDISLLFRPSVNIELGNYYLRYLLDKFDDNMVLAIAAYNWGEGSLGKWMKKSPPGDLDVFIESIPADETRGYVKKVLRSYAVYHSLYPSEQLTKAGY